ncbi:IclR family transcriptional regulator domain-containing protein [Nonomuraea helvata]|uniref:IclR family transcriptional regulator C-terminal domain-containing protein n=1 Tax=Nonomuraea helvata TaxID=37484 RepID=A0ABV5SAK5_9ACTN
MSEVLRHVTAVRVRGYDICDQELDRDVWVAAAPVRDPRRRVVAALSLAVPTSRAGDGARRRLLIGLVRDVAGQITSSDDLSFHRYWSTAV